MTTPAPARIDRQPNEVIDNDDINQLALVANRADANSRAAQETAEEALTEAQGKVSAPLTADLFAPGVLAVNVAGSPMNKHTSANVRNSALTTNHYGPPVTLEQFRDSATVLPGDELTLVAP